MDDSTSWEDVIRIIETLNVGFSRRLNGATADEIYALERCVGTPLPSGYAGFLAKMGHGLGGLELVSSNFEIDTVRAIYSLPSWRPPRELLFIGEQLDDSNGYDVCISLERERFGRVIRAVFSYSSPPISGQHAPYPTEAYEESLSLQSLVLRCAMLKYSLGRFSERETLISDTAIDMNRVEVIFHEYCIEKIPLYDLWTCHYVGDSVSAMFIRPQGVGAQLRIAANDKKYLERICRILHRECHLHAI